MGAISETLIDTIYNYRKLSPLIATGGQPDESELQNLSTENFYAVINLGLDDTDYAVPDEKLIVESQGIQYIHIPVSFVAPNPAHYFEFEKQLRALTGKKILIHCAANKRVSVFMALFRILNQQVVYAEAMQQVTVIWHPDNIWQGFIQKIMQLSDTAHQ